MSLKNARLPIQDLLQASANRVPTTATVYHINAIQLVDEVDLGKLFKYTDKRGHAFDSRFGIYLGYICYINAVYNIHRY